MNRPPVTDARRRRLLLAGVGAAGLQLLGRAAPLWAQPRFTRDPFVLGVASGDPASDGFVIWTRLAPAPLHDGGMPEAAVDVQWEVAEDEGFRHIVQRGTARAEPQWAHSLHVEVGGLKPRRWYWYRFRCGEAQSRVGRSLTLPAPGAPLERLRLAFASCQHFEQGWYTAYRDMAAQDLDVVLHLGDYIYERHHRAGAVRRHAIDEPRTLAEYRNHHAQYKTDPHLQDAHANFPWIVTWDDHDVQNDYAGALSQDNNPPEQFLLRRAAAYQAYYEHLPLRLAQRPRGPDALMYRRFRFGDLLEMPVTDDRQYRSDQPCGSPGYWGGQVARDCPERNDPARTMFGAEQERWLLDGLGRSGARWNAIAQQLLMAQLDERRGDDRAWWTDGWDGYPAARRRLLDGVRERGLRNVVVLGGDAHAFYAADLKPDFDDPKSPVVATEFTGTSITSDPGGPYEYFKAMLPYNPHIRFFDSRYRGYARCEITRRSWQTAFVAVDDVRDPQSAVRVLQRFAVEPERPGVQVA
ncbi:MAG: alkaline phosphatase [Nevskiaceae bacterium]|nr:MAG: alkaline phosphatase [Nevskiaceae bacterium]